jgi:hypothetical protein
MWDSVLLEQQDQVIASFEIAPMSRLIAKVCIAFDYETHRIQPL